MSNRYKKYYFFQGISASYCYMGSNSSYFPLHTEDRDLAAINFLHYGKPKIWIIISKTQKMEKIILESLKNANLLPECDNIFWHKDYLLTREFLHVNKIEYQTLRQKPGEFVVTFPRGYHFGFNTGLNFAESVNWGTQGWLEFGKNGLQCNCCRQKLSGAPFDMSLFEDPKN